MIRRLLSGRRELILYAAFGLLTTAVNFGTYALLYRRLRVPNVPSNAVAWTLAVACAFVTNKLWVFRSRSLRPRDILDELWKFVGFRLLTGLADLLVMFVAVDVLEQNAMLWKVVSNVLVVAANYAAGKLLVFRKGA